MDITTVLRSILATPQVFYLVALIVGALFFGVAAALASGTFRLANVADFAERHLVPVLLAYVAAAFVAWANPQAAFIRDLVFAALVSRLVASIASNLGALGIPLPSSFTDVMRKVTFVQHVSEAGPTSVSTGQPTAEAPKPAAPAATS